MESCFFSFIIESYVLPDNEKDLALGQLLLAWKSLVLVMQPNLSYYSDSITNLIHAACSKEIFSM